MAKHIILRKNHKKMPHILKLALFLCVLGIICSAILGGVNLLTKDRIAEHDQKALQETLSAVGLTDTKDITADFTLVSGVTGIYNGVNADNQICVAYKVSIKNKFTTVTTLVVINASTNNIDNIKVIGDATTLGKDKNDKFNNNDFGVIDSGETDFDGNFEIIAGSTWSSNSVKDAIKAAYEQHKVVGPNIVFPVYDETTDKTEDGGNN